MGKEELKNNLQEWLDNATENEIKAGQINFCISPTDLQQIIKALDTTQMVDKSNFDNKQYETDLDCAYDCGYSAGKSGRETTTVRKIGEFEREDKGFKVKYHTFCCNKCGRLMRYRWLEDGHYFNYCDWCGRKIINMPFKESETE